MLKIFLSKRARASKFLQMQSIDELVMIIRRLRAPDGCPWDREQTHKSIRGHLVEECAELLETIDCEDYPHMREELGDVLMHIMLHSEMASEEGRFAFDDVAKELAEKLVRRHPHVFAGKDAANSDDVLKIWKDVKKQEKLDGGKKMPANVFESLPPELSALRTAREVCKKVPYEILKEAAENSSSDASAKAGEKIFAAISECVAAGVEPEGALRDYIFQVRKICEKLGDAK